MRILVALLGNALGLLATTVVPGILFKGDLLTLLVAGAILGLFNLIVRPLAMLLDHIGENDAARRVREAVNEVLREGKHLTGDLGGKAGTTEVAEAIATRIQAAATS